GGVAEADSNLLVALAETGRWEELKLQLERQARSGKQPVEANLARIGARVPDQEVVERLWQTAQEGSPALLLTNLGVRAMQSNQYQQAARAFQLALTQRQAYPYAHANLGVLAFRQGDLKKAVAETAAAATLVADDDGVFANLGGLLSLAGDARGAEKWLQRARRLQPHNVGALLNLGLTQQLGGRADEAAATLQSALSLPGAAVTANYDLAHVYHAQGNEPRALEHLQAALADAQDDPEVLNNLVCVLFAQGQYEAAHDYFEQVAKVSRAGVYRRNVIRAELGAGRLEKANARLDELAGDDSVSLERGLIALLRATQIKAETETHRQMIDFNLSAAIAAFTKAIALGQSPIEASYNYGLAQYLRGEYRASAETFAQALKKPNGHPEMNYAAAMSYLFAGMREAVEHEATDGKLPGPVRELYLKARPYLEKASEVTSVAEVAIYDLGLLNYLLGDYQRGIDVLRKIVRNDSPPHLLNALAITQARLAQELQLTAQTASLMPDTKKRDIRQQAVKLLGSAIYYFKQALQAAPEASLTHANVGLALMLRNQRGDVEAALNHWQLMHQHGDARARKTFEQFMQAQSPDAAQRLRFQDVELVFRPLAVRDWLVLVPPTMSGPRYVISALLDVPEWQLQGHHRLVQRSLKYRTKAERVRRKLRRLAI
ncbi:MAG: tetratricopeptide repeat protein, partial [Armatimonadota bacterium]